MEDIKLTAKKVLMHTYNSIPIIIKSGKGCYLKDNEGKEYLDFIAGIAVNALGYNHTSYNTAIQKQLKEIVHFSNLFYNEEQIKLADKLISNSNFDKAFFCNSGTESVEAALKLAKLYGKQKKNGAWKIIAMEHSFHGRTSGALSLTGQKKYQNSFLPLLPGVSFVEFNNIKDLKNKIDLETCAIILEPIQGEGGINPAVKDYLEEVRNICTDNNIALIFDEVQSGIGRTGYLFAHEYFKVYPDIICLAKGLGGGLPIGAILSTDKFNLFQPGDHAATFGGNPLVCAGANAVLQELVDNNLLTQVKKSGIHLNKELKKLKDKHEIIKDLRGIGLMIGIELSIQVDKIISLCRDNGLLLVSAGQNVIRFVPPLIVTEAEIDKALKILDMALIKISE